MDNFSGIQALTNSTALSFILTFSKPPDWDLSPDALLWWYATNGILYDLLAFGKYKWHHQIFAMKFYHTYVVPNLGTFPVANRPPKWRSFMTDDFSPIEYSWNWGNLQGVVDRRVRFSIEAINEESGTATDPWNQKATLNLIDRLALDIPDLDMQWFHRILKDFTPSRNILPEAYLARLDPQQPRSTMFIAFELRDRMPVVKIYMMPFAKAMETSQPESTVILGSLTAFALELDWPSLQGLVQALELKIKSQGLEPCMIAFDCVAPKQSRMKIYARCPDIRLTSVIEVMSIFEDKSKIVNGLKELRRLWALVFSCCDESQADHLPYKEHITSGILYYFEVRPGSSKITTKIYLPVKHYAKDDISIARGLQIFFKERGSVQNEIAEDFLGVLNRMCTYRRLEAATGLQTYISCKIENDSLVITSYLSPEMYNEGRWSHETSTV
ncbi:hypothetical protein DID88_003666 [Monilinia fructigena]|uniref:Aromatic prenyltransferase n=1 Tax=Monilinia fructigena TaxID=38457 RepID=A0A395ITM6_9HELO|nr:hypothetical protein DID88_003666 [Monilinia fructigena]